jgi:hypothetical protein
MAKATSLHHLIGERVMLNRSKLIVAAVAAIAMLGIASPASAQEFDADWGTGNVMATYYDHTGGLHAGAAQQQQEVAVQRNGLNAFAKIPGAASGSDNPALTGGGSSGYNYNLRTDQW